MSTSTSPKLKTFYKNSTAFNEAGAKLIIDLDEHLDKIYNDYKNEGYSPREITQLILNSSFNKETKYSFEISEKIDKVERQKILDSRFQD